MSVHITQHPSQRFNVVHIPKKVRGQFRTIYAPFPEEKAALQALLPGLYMVAQRLCGPCVHGFMPCRSPVTNALAHVGYRFTLSMDLCDFFDTVNANHLFDKLGYDMIDRALVDGAPRQGLPTSPVVANIAATDMDAAILAALPKWPSCPAEWGAMTGSPPMVTYTRYADDLAFSFHCYETYVALKLVLPPIIEAAGFKVNVRKTRLQDARYGWRTITGVNVGAIGQPSELSIKGPDGRPVLAPNLRGIRIPRTIRRKIRAAKDARWYRSAQGLEEWAKLRLPYKPIEHTLAVLRGIWEAKRGKAAIASYGTHGQWDDRIKAVDAIGRQSEVRDHIAHYMRNGFKGNLFTKEEVKAMDALITEAKASRGSTPDERARQARGNLPTS